MMTYNLFSNYSDKEYRKKRYRELNGTYEWYEDYETIRPIINELKLPKRSKILHVGIGNSEFSEKMYDERYKKSYNIDIVRNLIKYMKERNKKLRASLIFETMDAIKISYKDETFDIIFDKLTLDCILCGIDSEKETKGIYKRNL